MKGFAPLIIVFILGLSVVAAGVYFFVIKGNSKEVSTKKVSPLATNNLKIHKDDNFTLEYPNDLVVKEDNEELYSKRNGGNIRQNFTGYVTYSPPKLIRAWVVISEKQTLDQAPFTAWVFDNPNNLNSVKWFDNFWYYPYLWGVFDYTSKGHIYPEKEATVGGKIANTGQALYQEGSPKYILLPSEDKMILIRVLTKDSVGDKILESFRIK